MYLATDNKVTQDELCDGRRFHVGTLLPDSPERQENGDQRRWSSLAGAVVDIYTCAGASQFMGSPGSSFTDMIETLRGFR